MALNVSNDSNKTYNKIEALPDGEDIAGDQQTQKTKGIATWLSCRLELSNLIISKQCFDISGYINVFWTWPEGKNTELKNLPEKEFYKINECVPYKVKCDEKQDFENKKEIPSNVKRDKKHPVITIWNLHNKNVKWNDQLPLAVGWLFHASSRIEYAFTDNSLVYNYESGECHLSCYLEATLLEPLELFSFPFDFQFLNIKLNWNHHLFAPLAPNEKGKLDKFERGHPAIVTQIQKRASIVTWLKEEFFENIIKIGSKDSNIYLLPTWIYFDHNERISYAWIRLRIQRSPIYHVITSIFPAFMIVACSFGAFAFNDTKDALPYAITVLLTFVAYMQEGFIEELPKLSEMLFIHYYVCMGYIVQGLVIIWSSIKDYMNVSDSDVFAYLIIGIWIFITLLYLLLWFKACCLKDGVPGGEIYDPTKRKKCTRYHTLCHFCCKYYESMSEDWGKRERNEREQWQYWVDEESQYKPTKMGSAYF